LGEINLFLCLFLLPHQAAIGVWVPALQLAVSKQAGYQMTFSANWISLAVVVVEVSKPAAPVGEPVESKMSVLSGVTGTAKFAWFKILKNSALNCTLKFSEMRLM